MSRFGFFACCLFVMVNTCVAQEPSAPAVQEPTAPAAKPAAVTAAKSGKTIFVSACTSPSYPSPPPRTKPGIDSLCGVQGSGGAEANQNMAKNNFCATGTPSDMTIDDFTNLQTQVENDSSIPFGTDAQGGREKGPAVDRAPLRALGEGKLVRMQGFVLFGREEGAESVNCEKTVPNQPADHDIHIELVGSAGQTDECSGVVAEMIPHHRPDTWTADNVEQLAGAQLPVRVTGQLFFDSSHFPCQNGAGVADNPKRISLWEVHPIYAFEVCSSGDCSSDSGWVPLDQWLSTEIRKKRK
ncbi:MAG: hypothetical protein JO051_02895 [Acidobacteriaceae bacterium]|nr:hypothetical protein [Acidobacteriaceae bacterium]